MAAVDLNELIPDLKAAMTPLGSAETSLETVSDEEWTSRLNNAFWTAYNQGLLEGFTCNADGIVTPISGTATFTRDLQQIVILYCAINEAENGFRQIKTRFKAKAGPVEYETEQSATVLKTIMDSLLSQKAIILDRLAVKNTIATVYIDSVRQRDDSMRRQYIDWNY
jgi:hypothetical protein